MSTGWPDGMARKKIQNTSWSEAELDKNNRQPSERRRKTNGLSKSKVKDTSQEGIENKSSKVILSDENWE